MLLLGIDFETTGLDAKNDRIIEIGAVLWDTDEGKPLAMLSELIHDHTYPVLSKEIIGITGITEPVLEKFAKTPIEGFNKLLDLVSEADMLVAHNAPFDRGFFEAECGRQARKLVPPGYIDEAAAVAYPKWIDTSVDVPYPPRVQTRKLVHLAAEHGFVNPFAHRAAFDVLTMLKVLSCYSTEEVVKLAHEPNVTLVAKTVPPWEDQGRSTDLAKARGYRWDGAKKLWQKNVKKSQAEREQSHGEFPVLVMEATA